MVLGDIDVDDSGGLPAAAGVRGSAAPRRPHLEGRLHHLDVPGYPYFVTTNVAGRARIFDLPANAELLRSVIYWCREQGRFLLLAFAIMPDHLHIVLAPKRPYTVSRCMHAIKGYSSYKINRATARRGQLWQENFFDYALDSEEKVRTRVNTSTRIRCGLDSSQRSPHIHSVQLIPETRAMSRCSCDPTAGPVGPAYRPKKAIRTDSGGSPAGPTATRDIPLGLTTNGGAGKPRLSNLRSLHDSGGLPAAAWSRKREEAP